jgi:erythrocyte band 7 integral membrane protein
MPGASSSASTAGLAAAANDPKNFASETGESSGKNNMQDFGGQDPSFQQAMNARMIENI